MRMKHVIIYSAVIAALASAQGVSAQNRQAAPATPATAENLPAPAVSEPADRLIKEMSAYIGSAKEFTFQADVTFDHVLPSGQKLQFSVQRPGGSRSNGTVISAPASSGITVGWSPFTTRPCRFMRASLRRPRSTICWSSCCRNWISCRRSAIFSIATRTRSCGNIQYGFDLGRTT